MAKPIAIIGRPVQFYPGTNTGGGQDSYDPPPYVADPLPPVVVPPGNSFTYNAHRGQDLATCLAYVKKYRASFGRDPVGVWCLNQSNIDQPPRCATGFIARGQECVPVPPVYVPPPPPVYLPPAPPVVVPPVVVKPPRVIHPMPPIRVQPPSPITPGPIHRWRPKPLPRPIVRRPHKPKQKPVAAPTPVVQAAASSELCPVAGYVSRPIAGASEYQIFRCSPGQPVVIDAGLQAAGRAEALARRPGLSDLGLLVGNIDVPDWLPIAAIGIAVFAFFKMRR